MVSTSADENDETKPVKFKRISDINSKNKTERRRKNSNGRKESAADTRWKFACMEENDELRRIYEERPYLVEIVEKALISNTIVCLGTGTGKTFISATIIKEMQGGIGGTFNTNGKRTIFLVNLVPLVYQQAHVIKSMTNLNVCLYTGDMRVDFWSKEKWREEFDKHDVLVMTSHTLVNILNNSFITIKNINLLIFDECHNAAKKHPYAQILRFFDQYSVEEQPHILGLTASIINKKYIKRDNEIEDIRSFLLNHMEALEKRMRSKCITCLNRKSLEKWTNKATEMIKTYQITQPSDRFCDIYEMGNEEGELVQGLYNASRRFKVLQNKSEGVVNGVLNSIIAGVEHIEKENMDSDRRKSFEHSYVGLDTMRSNNVLSVVADAAKYCADMLCELGPWCGYEAAKIIMKQLGKHKEGNSNKMNFEYLEECLNLLNEIKTRFEKYVENTEYKKVRDVKLVEPFISGKAFIFLNEILLEEKKAFRTEDEGDIHAIVLVERRCTAVILDKLINFQARSEKERFDGIKSRFILGHGLCTNIHLADSNMKSVDQSKVIKEFKSGAFNILVATSVIEEGLDVRQCNLVVRFDGMENYRQYVQSKGRARAKNSKFVVMVPEDNKKEAKLDLKINQEIESLLNEMCLAERGLANKEGIEKLVDNKEEEKVPTYYAHAGPDAAQINHNTAVALIHRYCSMLPRDLYSSTCPHFEYTSRNNETEFQATLFVPMNFPLVQKVYQSLWFSEKSICKKWVCLHVCIALHVAHELDDNLLPVRHTKEDSDFEEDRDEMKPKEGTRKSQDYYHRKYPDLISPNVLTFDTCELFVLSITLPEPRDRPSSIALRPFWFEEEKKGFGILLPPGMPKNLPPIKMYTRAGGISVSLIHLQNDNNAVDRESALQFHCAMMDICAGKHIFGKYLFDIDDERVSKGILIPLKPSAFTAIDSITNGNPCNTTQHDNFIDLNGIDRYVRGLADVGRDNDADFTNAIINKTYLNEQQNRRLYYIAGFSDQQGKDIMDGETTYAEYYLSKYNHILDDETYLLEAVPCPSRVNFSEDLAKKDCTKQSTYKPERLVLDLCKKAFRTHAHLHQQLNLLPYILYMFESILNAYELRERMSCKLRISREVYEKHLLITDLTESSEQLLANMLRQSTVVNETTKSPSIMEILETLTTRQAKFPYDLERLEMLGDSFLKQAVSVYLFFKHPKAHEGTLSSKRKRCISNKNLCRIAKSKEVGIQHIICNSQFGNVNPGNENQNSLTVWLPPGYYRVEDEKLDEDIDDTVKKIFDELLQTIDDNENVTMDLENMTISESSIDGLTQPKDSDSNSSNIKVNLNLENVITREIEIGKRDSDLVEVNESAQTTVGSFVVDGVITKTYELIRAVDSDENEENETLEECKSNRNSKQLNVEVATKPSISSRNCTQPETDDSNDPTKDDIPISISKDLPFQLVQDKSLADCVEALIGLHFKIGGTNLALHFMQEFLSIDVLFDAIPDKEICKVQMDSQSKYADFPCQRSVIQNTASTYNDVIDFYEQMKLDRLEDILCYEFKDKSFLVQAMTHLSYQKNNVTGCYQQLEFLGDAILDFLVTLHIYMYKPDLSPGDLTSLRSALVNNNTFGLLVIKFEWHTFLKHFSPKLHHVCQEFLSVVNETPSALDGCFENPFVIVRENCEEGFHAPKVLGDIFESIAGAVFLDSCLDLVETWRIFYPFMKGIIDKYMEKIPLNPIREFHEKYTTGSLSYEQIDNEMVVCTATYANGKTKTGIGKNKRIAKATVCHKAVYGC